MLLKNVKLINTAACLETQFTSKLIFFYKSQLTQIRIRNKPEKEHSRCSIDFFKRGKF